MSINTYKVVVVGASSVGKTAIVQRLIEGTFSVESQSTIGVEFRTYPMKIGDETIKLNIWDTAGQEKFRSVSKAYFRNAVGAVLCFALNDRQSFEDLDGWINDLHQLCATNSVILLVGNKSDLVENRKIMQSEAEAFAERHNLVYLESSALDGANITETFVRLSNAVHEKVKKGEIRGHFQANNPPLILNQTKTNDQAAGSSCC